MTSLRSWTQATEFNSSFETSIGELLETAELFQFLGADLVPKAVSSEAKAFRILCQIQSQSESLNLQHDATYLALRA